MNNHAIYIGTNSEEATAHGHEYVYPGLNPADALAKFVSDEDAMDTVRHDHGNDLTSIAAFDDDSSAEVYPLDNGAWELHVYTYDGNDITITIPPTEYMSATEAADELNISRQRVNVMLQNGQLSGRLVGNTWSVCRASVEQRKNIV